VIDSRQSSSEDVGRKTLSIVEVSMLKNRESRMANNLTKTFSRPVLIVPGEIPRSPIIELAKYRAQKQW
jgi:hypothetical protein